MAITVSQILEFMNDAYTRPDALAWEESGIALALKMCLRDMSTRELLMKSTTGSVIVGASSFTWPTQFLHIKSLVFTDSDGNVGWPTTLIVDDFKGYGRWSAQRLGNGVPCKHVEHNGSIYFFYPADGTYTYTLKYYGIHLYPAAGEDITVEFSDKFLLAIQYGTAYYQAKLKRNKLYMETWLPDYLSELQKFKGSV